MITDPFAYLAFLGLFIGGAFAFRYGLKERLSRRVGQEVPFSKIRGLAVGPVEIKGKVVPLYSTLKSFLERKECVYYECRQDKWDKNSIPLIKKGHVTFLLDDGSGKVPVNLAGADVILPYKKLRTSFFKWNRPPGATIKFPVISFSELRIDPGDELYILGHAAQNGNRDKDGYPLFIRKDARLVVAKNERSAHRNLFWSGILNIFLGVGLMLAASGFLVLLLTAK